MPNIADKIIEFRRSVAIVWLTHFVNGDRGTHQENIWGMTYI